MELTKSLAKKQSSLLTPLDALILEDISTRRRKSYNEIVPIREVCLWRFYDELGYPYQEIVESFRQLRRLRLTYISDICVSTFKIMEDGNSIDLWRVGLSKLGEAVIAERIESHHV